MNNNNDNHSFLIHDCPLIGIRVNEKGNKAILTIMSSDKWQSFDQEKEIALEGIYKLLANNFCEGNIILDLNTYAWPDIPIDKLAKLFQVDDEYFINTLSKTIIDKVKRDHLSLFELTSSYGCEILALYKYIKYFDK